MSATEEFPEYLVKFRLDHGKFFRKLPAHSGIQFLDDLVESILSCNEVIMLGFHKFVAPGDLLVILDRVDIDVSETADRVLFLRDLAFHIRHII